MSALPLALNGKTARLMYEYRKLTPEQRKDLVEERLARGYPPHCPPHPVRLRTCYLLTAACYEHECHMRSEERRRQLLDKLLEQFISAGMEIRAWVILPNHYHLLVDKTDFDQLGRLFHMVHDQTSHTTLNCLHYNPVKHGWEVTLRLVGE